MSGLNLISLLGIVVFGALAWLGLRPAPEFEAWLQRMKLVDDQHRLLPVDAGHRLLELVRSVEE